MPYHIEPAAVLEGEAAERFIDMIRAAQKGSIDFPRRKPLLKGFSRTRRHQFLTHLA